MPTACRASPAGDATTRENTTGRACRLGGWSRSFPITSLSWRRHVVHHCRNFCRRSPSTIGAAVQPRTRRTFCEDDAHGPCRRKHAPAHSRFTIRSASVPVCSRRRSRHRGTAERCSSLNFPFQSPQASCRRCARALPSTAPRRGSPSSATPSIRRCPSPPRSSSAPVRGHTRSCAWLPQEPKERVVISWSSQIYNSVNSTLPIAAEVFNRAGARQMSKRCQKAQQR